MKQKPLNIKWKLEAKKNSRSIKCLIALMMFKCIEENELVYWKGLKVEIEGVGGLGF